MGLPDFLKFAARSAPDALVPVAEMGGGCQKMEFDFALVDATNAAQTIGFDQLFHLFALSNIMVKVAIVFAVDSQRERRDVARRLRQSRSIVGDLEIKVKAFCTRLANGMANLEKEKPLFLISGRGTVGEADYKILDIHRAIVSSTMYYEKPTPTFLFVSEDSDILCGTLCGPAPQSVSIATTLHDTTFKMNILRVSFVTTYVAACVEAVATEQLSPEVSNAQISPTHVVVKPDPVSIGDKVEKNTSSMLTKSEEEEDTIRRRKKDGPMIATGLREVLVGSDSDEEEDKERVAVEVGSTVSSSSGVSNRVTSHILSESPISRDIDHMDKEGFETQAISPLDLTAGWITYFSCVDLVFLFQLIMGNGDTIPPLVRGATKVDIQSCWAAYCRHKYDDHTGAYGRQLLRMAATSEDDLEGTMVLDTGFLYYILDAVHYTDGIARPPTAEERNTVVEFLSTALSSTVRYIVGCNVQGGDGNSTLKETILDSRPATHSPSMSPNIAAMRWVLESGPSALSFKFSLDASGNKDKENKNSNSRSSTASLLSAVHTSLVSSFSTPDSPHGVSSECDVGAHLISVYPPSRSRGFQEERSRVVTIDAIVQQCLLQGMAQKTRSAISVGKKLVASCNTALKAISDPPSVYRRDCSSSRVFPAIVINWALSIAHHVPEIRKIGRRARFISPATGRLVVGPLSAGLDGSSAENEKGGHLKEMLMTYSFELRRMIPVVGPSSDVPHQAKEGKDEGASPSSHHSALLRALGVSFSYANEDVHSSAAPPMEESTPQHDDHPKKKRRAELNSSESRIESPATGSREDGKKKSRPGKKERMKRNSVKFSKD